MEEALVPTSSCLTGSTDGQLAAASAAAPVGTASGGLVQSLKQACSFLFLKQAHPGGQE